jgi:hypothetical protein
MAAFNDYGQLNRELSATVDAAVDAVWIKVQLHLDMLTLTEVRALEQCIQGALSQRFAESRLMRAVRKKKGERDAGTNGRAGNGGAHSR